MTKIRFKSVGAVVGAAALVLAMSTGASAEVLSDFTVTPTGLGSQDPTQPSNIISAPFTADALKGGYTETFTVTGFDAMTGTGTFVTDAYWTPDAFYTNDGTTSIPGLTTGLGNTYLLYAVFTATGTFEQIVDDNGTPLDFTDDITTVTFVATGGTISLYVDYVEPITTLAVPADASTGDVAVLGNTDDELLATAPLFFGEGNATDEGLANGNFEIIFQPFSLTSLGSSYFTYPDPFYMVVNVAGQFNFFSPAPGTSFELQGSADAWFSGAPDVVPEPASLVLLGSGLLGLAARRRSRKA